MLKDNAKVLENTNPIVQDLALEQPGLCCLLLCDGRLFGPFQSKNDALYWCEALELKGYSTYDLLPPTMVAKMEQSSG